MPDQVIEGGKPTQLAVANLGYFKGYKVTKDMIFKPYHIGAREGKETLSNSCICLGCSLH